MLVFDCVHHDAPTEWPIRPVTQTGQYPLPSEAWMSHRRCGWTRRPAALGEFWSQDVVGRANGNLLKVAKGIGSTVWHSHADQDEVFLVTSGTLVVQLRTRRRHARPGRAARRPARRRALPEGRRGGAPAADRAGGDVRRGGREAGLEPRRRAPARGVTAEQLARLLGTDWALGGGTLAGRLALALRHLLEGEVLAGGTRLPPERALAHAFHVSRPTITAALGELRERGLLEARQGSGTWVAERAASAPSSAAMSELVLTGRGINLAAATAHDASHLGPLDVDLLAATPARRPRSQRPARPAGSSSRCVTGSTAEGLIITNGAHHALALVLGALCRPGERVIVEEHTYAGFLDLLEAARVRAIAIPQRCRRPRARRAGAGDPSRATATRVPDAEGPCPKRREHDATASRGAGGDPRPPRVHHRLRRHARRAGPARRGAPDRLADHDRHAQQVAVERLADRLAAGFRGCAASGS